MKRWKQLTLTFAVLIGLGAAVLPTADVSAINLTKDACTLDASSPICAAVQKDNAADMTKKIINTMLYVLGIIAVIMIVVSGIRYTTSAGDASKVKAAKDTLTYSVVGLVVAIFAFAIVNFVITRFN
jgi:glucose uptake protein GlcU